MFYLRFTKPDIKPYSLPSGLTRHFIDSPNGKLELLAAEPPSTYSGPRKRPIFFSHGGMGYAGEWVEWMTYLSQVHNIPCYAISLRGHGFSWYPSYIRMVYFTTKRALANDLVTGVKFVEKREGELTGDSVELVLAGHSSGGGLSQIILNAGDISVAGLILVASIPCYGSIGVYWNWWTMDVWFSLRAITHFWHPNSPLSSTRLVKRAFFCNEKPDEEVDEFMLKASHYESYLWPIGMMFGKLVDVKNVIKRITGWGTSQRIMILAAEKDTLMHVPQMRKAAEHYRKGVVELAGAKKLDANIGDVKADAETGDSDGAGVRFRIIPGAGHHVQNDLQWEDGAKAMAEFYEQL